MGWTVQLLPFHRSASVRVALPLVEEPTAVQMEAVGQETEANDATSASDGSPGYWNVQSVPSHRSASGTGAVAAV